MPPGGARVRSGPPPDPNALRRERDKTEWTTLPAEGRLGDPPPWPLTKPTAREMEHWRELWATPQATMWKGDQRRLVALYVRRYRDAEKAGSPAAVTTAVARLADMLGISDDGMAKKHWKIGSAKESEQAPAPVAPFRPKVVADALEGA